MMLFFSLEGTSQNTQVNANSIMETINTSGNNATGSSGTVAYSIGQVFYTYIGESVYTVAQGIQHEEGKETLNTPTNIPNTEIFIFPNPVLDFVYINMKEVELENGLQYYKLYDCQGRLLRQNIISQTETQVNLNDLRSSIYILNVYVNDKVFKTFKILKK